MYTFLQKIREINVKVLKILQKKSFMLDFLIFRQIECYDNFTL